MDNINENTYVMDNVEKEMHRLIDENNQLKQRMHIYVRAIEEKSNYYAVSLVGCFILGMCVVTLIYKLKGVI